MYVLCAKVAFFRKSFYYSGNKDRRKVVKCKIFIFLCISDALKEHKKPFLIDKKVIKVRFLILYT